jgi:hypothetical protein
VQLRCKHIPNNREAVFSAWSVQSGYKEELVEFRDASLQGYELGSRGIELSWRLQNNIKNELGGAI